MLHSLALHFDRLPKCTFFMPRKILPFFICTQLSWLTSHATPSNQKHKIHRIIFCEFIQVATNGVHKIYIKSKYKNIYLQNHH